MSRLAPVPVIAVLAAGLAFPAPAAAETDYFAFLKASSHYPAARGDSEYERSGTRREIEVTVTGLPDLAGRRVTVYVNRHKVGRMRVSSRGRAHREWSTEHQQRVPTAHAGTRIRLRGPHGTLIASGRYEREADDDD